MLFIPLTPKEIKDGGTGADNASQARTNLDVSQSNHLHTGVYAPNSHTHSYAATNHLHTGVYAPNSHIHSYAALLHNHSANNITSGVFSVARIPSLPYHPMSTPLGKIRQIAQTVDTINRSTTSATLVASGVSAAFPSSVLAGSKVLISVCGTTGTSTQVGGVTGIALYRGTTSLIPAGLTEHQTIYISILRDAANAYSNIVATPFGFQYLDSSPGTNPTYDLYFRAGAGDVSTAYLGRNGSGTADNPTILTIMEIMA